MTNYPPPQGQPPYGQPPAGYGAPSPYGQPGAAMTPPASNGWSVAALVTGIVGFCVPGIGGLLAILFGFLGIKRAGVTKTGKGMAIAGLVLGLVTIAGYAIVGGSLWAAYKATEPNRDIGKQFLNDLASQNLTNAATAVDGTVIDADDLKKLSDVVTSTGTIQDITTVGIEAKTSASTSEVVLAGGITFTNGQSKSFSMRQVKQNGKWVIVEVRIQ